MRRRGLVDPEPVDDTRRDVWVLAKDIVYRGRVLPRAQVRVDNVGTAFLWPRGCLVVAKWVLLEEEVQPLQPVVVHFHDLDRESTAARSD